MAATRLIKYLLYLVLLSTYKSLPMAYYVRIYWIFAKNLVLARSLPQLFPYGKVKYVFQVSEYKTYNSPFECDFYMHKSNSCYIQELDVARAELMTLVFQRFFVERPTESKTWVFVPVANVFCSFKKEIKPFQRYNIRSRVMAWDQKWIFILSQFVTGKDKVCASAVTKYVLKDGRKTVPPIDALKFSGLWSEEAQRKSDENLKLVDYFVNTDEIDGFEL